MSERGYWEDPYRTTFTARVVDAFERDGAFWVALDRTFFYPTAGGQPHDTGTLGGARVLEVIEEEKHSGRILHRLDRPLTVGAEVEGKIDWPRRYRHMQRHTAQHILSQAFLRAGRWNTVAVSLKNPVFTIDFDLPPDAGVIKEAEALANWAVYANLPVRAYLVEEARVPLLPLRRLPKARGTVRVVEIEDWDLAPCGGTHLRTTAEAGPIKVLGYERWKKNTTRVYASAGWEALEDYVKKHEALKGLAERFSARPLEVPERVQKLEAELFAARGEAEGLRRLLADRLVAGVRPPAVLEVPEAVLDEVARRLAERRLMPALVLAAVPPRARFVLLGGEDDWARLQSLGARGGGRAGRYQGVLDLGALEAAKGLFSG